MRVTRHKRQVLLFLAAILVPAAVLVGLASRTPVSGSGTRRQTGGRPAARRSRPVAPGTGCAPGSDQAAGNQPADSLARWEPAQDSDNPAVIFTATVEGDRLVLPWEVPASVIPRPLPGIAQEGEVQEFSKKDYAGAAAAYRLALASARRSLGNCGGPPVAGARALQSRQTEEAFRLYHELVERSRGCQGRTRSRLPLLRR